MHAVSSVIFFTFEEHFVGVFALKMLPSTELKCSLTFLSTGRLCCIFWEKEIRALGQLHSGAGASVIGSEFDESTVQIQ